MGTFRKFLEKYYNEGATCGLPSSLSHAWGPIHHHTHLFARRPRSNRSHHGETGFPHTHLVGSPFPSTTWCHPDRQLHPGPQSHPAPRHSYCVTAAHSPVTLDRIPQGRLTQKAKANANTTRRDNEANPGGSPALDVPDPLVSRPTELASSHRDWVSFLPANWR